MKQNYEQVSHKLYMYVITNSTSPQFQLLPPAFSESPSGWSSPAVHRFTECNERKCGCWSEFEGSIMISAVWQRRIYFNVRCRLESVCCSVCVSIIPSYKLHPCLSHTVNLRCVSPVWVDIKSYILASKRIVQLDRTALIIRCSR